MAEPIVATYSIAACDLAAGHWGVATQSKFLAVGSVVPWAEPAVGAVATQAYANPRYGPDGLALLREGASAEEAVAKLTAADEGRETRQLGVVDAHGGSATFTGKGCFDLGRRADRPVLRRAGEHPGRAGDGRQRSPRPSRRRRAARSRHGSSIALRPHRRPAVIGAASSRRRCWSSNATAGTRGSATSSSTCASTTTRSRSPSSSHLRTA